MKKKGNSTLLGQLAQSYPAWLNLSFEMLDQTAVALSTMLQ